MFELVGAAGFEPADFSLGLEGDDVTVLRHQPSGSQLAIAETMFTEVGDPKVALRSVIEDGRERMMWVNADDWEGEASWWLTDLRSELEAHDPWAELNRETSLSPLVEGQENTPFTSDEQAQIAEVVARLLEQANEADLPEEERGEVQSALEYAADTASWIPGRRDWVIIVSGYVFTKVAEGVLTTDTMRLLFHWMTAGFGPLFGHPVLGP
jgi:hypothetical protein